MKLKSEIIWAFFLIVTATLAFWLGTRIGALETEENLETRIEERAKDVKVLEQKIQQLSEELTSRGIFSYPQANLLFEEDDTSVIVLITLNGREPLPNLEIERKVFMDYDGNAENLRTSETSGTKTYLGDLSAHNPVSFEINEFGSKLAMDLTYRSEGKQWQQFIRAEKTSDGEIKTFWIIVNQYSEVIDKHIDPGFPVDEEGKIPLWEDKKVEYSEIRMNSVLQ